MYDYQKLIMNDNIRLKTKLLNLLEERYKKDPNFFVNKSTISVDLGITEEEASRYADYLVNNKWATVSEPQTSRWRIMITEEGREERERIRDVIVDEKKNNTNEQFGDAKLSKNEEKIKDVNLEKIPSEKSESPQRTQKENPKVILQAYLIELKKTKDARNAHSVQRVGERLLEFIKKLQLTYVESVQLNDELKAMINMSFGQRRSNMLSTGQKSLNELFDKYVAKYIDKVIYLVETLIDLPKEITLRKKPLPVEKKKSWFSKLFSSKQKNKMNFRKYLEIKNSPDVFYENLILEINKAYDNDMSLTVLILLRKLFETGIIDLIWKKYKSDDIYRTKKGGFKQFGAILDEIRTKTIGGDFAHFKDDVLEVIDFVDTIREKGNESVHRLTFDISIKEIEKMKKEVKRSSEILFRVMANV